MAHTRAQKTLAVVVVAFIAALLLRAFVVEGFVVRGDSMSPTIQNGDYVIVFKLAYLRHDPTRGDIVVATPRQYNQKVVKRVAVLPGEVYELAPGKLDKIDPGAYFLVGDNSAVSVDSRQFGPVDRWDITGRVVADIRIKSLKLIYFH